MRNIFLLILLLPLVLAAQPSQQPGAAQIRLQLKKLNFLGSVLYVAAHPDDENTDIISYLSNGQLAATGYLSMTRGDGGQNLIGPEIRDLLGLIRTQELLAARRIDGGQQFFTRANDFGYSKSVDETLTIWGKEAILSDVVKVFRQYQPDVIITRFPPDARAGHGQHTASAVLAGEAFDVASKGEVFPDQVKEFGTWQVKRLYTNTGRWWNKDINENTPGIITLDVGGFSTLLGKSYSEISAMSSSQHKSQGWGRRGERGYQPEFLEHLQGEKAEKNIFEGVNTTWSRVKNSEKVQALVDRAIKEYNGENPSTIVPILLQLRKEISLLEKSVWRDRKLRETEQLIQDCLGLFIEVTAGNFLAAPGEIVPASIEVVNRSGSELKLEEIHASVLKWDTVCAAVLAPNILIQIRSKAVVDSNAPYSGPYWLKEPHDQGKFTVTNQANIGLPELSSAIEFIFKVKIGNEELLIKKPLIYKWVDPVKGELWRPFEIVPPLSVNPVEKVVIFNSAASKELRLVIRSSAEKPIQGNLSLSLPKGWKSEPENISFELEKRGDEQIKSFQVYPAADESSELIRAVATVGDKKYDQSLQIIAYDHIPTQTLLPKANIKAIHVNLKKEGAIVGYIKGAGDEIPSALRNMGYEVWEMKDEEVSAGNLKRMDAVVLGIRAINTNSRIRYFMDDLLEYVNGGGTLVVQYNTNFDYETEKFSPFPLKISRDRVTEEDAQVRILKADHPVLNTPNKISETDFSGWIQERGLYFPNSWDPAFEPVFSMNDKGENPKDGSLLIAKYGQGYYVYTGLSFFRELPEGVAGAYKLFANIVSMGKQKKIESTKGKRKKMATLNRYEI